MTKEGKGSDVLKYLKKIGIAREKGGAIYEESLRLAGTVKGAAIKLSNMIHKAMKAKESDVITIKRRSLPELVGTIALESPEGVRSPTIKASVREHLRARGIKIKYSRLSGLVDFIKIEPKKYNKSI